MTIEETSDMSLALCKARCPKEEQAGTRSGNYRLHCDQGRTNSAYKKQQQQGCTTTPTISRVNCASVQPLNNTEQHCDSTVIVPDGISVNRSNYPERISIVRKWKVAVESCDCGCFIYMWTFNSLICLFLNYVAIVNRSPWAIYLALPANALLLWMIFDLIATSFFNNSPVVITASRNEINVKQRDQTPLNCLCCFRQRPVTRRFKLHNPQRTQTTIDCERCETQYPESEMTPDVYYNLCLVEKNTTSAVISTLPDGDDVPLMLVRPPLTVLHSFKSSDVAVFFAREIETFLFGESTYDHLVAVKTV